MAYTMLFLFFMGLLGMTLQFLVKLDSINRHSNGAVNWKYFFLIERFSILISFHVIVAATLLSQEIKQLEHAGKWLGLGMFSIGYMAQSLLTRLMNKIQSYAVNELTKKTEPKPTTADTVPASETANDT